MDNLPGVPGDDKIKIDLNFYKLALFIFGRKRRQQIYSFEKVVRKEIDLDF